MSYEQRRQQQYSWSQAKGGHEDEEHDSALYQSAPSISTRQTVKFVTATTIGTVLLILSGLILTGTVLSLILSTPLLVLFSPILIPAAITLFFLASGFLFSGGCAVASLSALSWIYQYVTGQHPVGADHLDRARITIAHAASDVKDKATENLHFLHHNPPAHHQHTTPHTTS